jgi:hypothetical protein
MLGDIATTILYFAMGALGILIIGFSTPKILIYGTLATGLMWISAPLVPGYTHADAEAMLPHLYDILSLFPQAFKFAYITGNAEYGLLGIIIYVLVAALFTIPYLFGCYLGIRHYPELLVLRILV